MALTQRARIKRLERRPWELEVGRPQDRQSPWFSHQDRLSHDESRPVQVNLHDAKTHLSRYVNQALAGEEVVIARAGKRLVPLAAAVGPRRGGFLRGQATISADIKADFQQDMEEMFFGE